MYLARILLKTVVNMKSLWIMDGSVLVFAFVFLQLQGGKKERILDTIYNFLLILYEEVYFPSFCTTLKKNLV